MNMGRILLLGIGVVFLAVGFIVYPIVTTGTDTLLAYAYSANAAITDSTYTGFTAIIGITPILVLLGYLMAGVITMYLGVNVLKDGGSTKLDLGTLIMLAISMVFVAVGIIIMPVMLDGLSSVLHGGGAGINAAYVGLEAIIGIVPMIVLIAFVSASVFSGFMGVKNMGAGDS